MLYTLAIYFYTLAALNIILKLIIIIFNYDFKSKKYNYNYFLIINHVFTLLMIIQVLKTGILVMPNLIVILFFYLLSHTVFSMVDYWEEM